MKSVQLLPYLTFDGNCHEAMEYYKEILGGQLVFNYFKDMYGELPEGEEHKIMHSELQNEALSLMASDTVPGMETTFGDNVRITLTGTDDAKLASFFEKLSEGGAITMPFEEQAWGQRLGMLTDKFGTHWMVSVRAE